jgi:NADH dehydrogenase
VRQLSSTDYPLRALIRPSPRSPRLPKGVPVEVAVVSLADVRGLRAAMRDVDIVFHLASAESQGSQGSLLQTDIQGTRNLVEAAADADVRRFFFISHIGAERASGYPAFRAKGLAEEAIQSNKVPYTIIRTSLVYGPEDNFTTSLAQLLRMAPGLFPIPSGGRTVVQPLWVEDLVTCLIWAMDNPGTINQTYEVGGTEYFTFQQIAEVVMLVSRTPRVLFTLSPNTLRAITVFLGSFIPNLPVSSFWLDYFAVNRTCPVDSMPRLFGLMPARFTYRLDYLIRKPWYEQLWTSILEALRTLVARVLKSLRSIRPIR